MSTLKVYWISAEYEGKKIALLTLKWTEMNAFIAELIRETSEVQFTVKQYMSTEVDFKTDLRALALMGFKLRGYDDKIT